jgi:hypothetical protein
MEDVCARCSSLWLYMSQRNPVLPTSSACALALGFRNRFQLARWLGMHHYPTYGRIVDWFRLLHWLTEWQARATPLTRQAWAQNIEPSVCHRTIRRLCGVPWNDAKRKGLEYWVEQFKCEVVRELVCHRPAEPRGRLVGSSAGQTIPVRKIAPARNA